jgi:glucose/arabinose dehydrogenase
MLRRTIWPAASLLVGAIAVLGTTGESVRAATAPAGFSDTFVADVSRATAVEWLPSDQIVVLEQRTGRVRVATPGGAFSTALDLDVCDDSERGLLGLTADPAFLANGRVYVYYTARTGGGCVNRVSRFTLAGTTVDPASEVILLDNIASTGGNHNGGDLDIDGQGNLLVAIGDSGRDPRGDSGSAGSNDAAQDLSLLNGKIVRITRDGAPAPGNPFVGSGTSRCAFSGTSAPTSTRCQEIFAFGLRNPYRIAVDRNDGAGTFFINDVGQNTFEEVNVGRIAADYGWPAREGACPQGRTSNCPGPPANVTDPITAYGRNLGTYITAGAFVPDGLWPAEYDGAYLFGDGGSGRIWLREADGSVDYGAPFATDAFGLTDMAFGFDSDGVMVLYYVQVGGGLRKITPNSIPAQSQATGLKTVPVTPFRVYDTGNGTGAAAGDVFNGSTRLVDLDAPAGAKAALVNLTYDRTTGPGFIRTWAARTKRPDTSALNADRAATTAANSAVVALASDGTFVLESATTARVVVDVMAWFVDAGGATDDGRFAHPDLPDDGPLARAGSVGAVVISVGAISGGAPGGFVGAHPFGTPYLGTSNVNVLDGEIRANMMIVPLVGPPIVSLETLNIADVVVDVLGYITSDDAAPSETGLYSSVAPVRIVDSRVPVGFPTLPPGTSSASVSMPPSVTGASAVVQNLTATNTSAPGWLAAHPTTSVPVISNVNFEAPGQTRAALAFTTISPSDVEWITSLVATDVVVDVVGYFSD